MGPSAQHGNRIYYINQAGQKVNPMTGQTISNNDPWAHITW
jgi:hypothetical protein